MEVAKTLIIPIDGKHRIVDESEIVCRYRQLSYEADEAVPYSFLSTIMLNTKKRHLLHNQRVTLSWSIGVPNCELYRIVKYNHYRKHLFAAPFPLETYNILKGT